MGNGFSQYTLSSRSDLTSSEKQELAKEHLTRAMRGHTEWNKWVQELKKDMSSYEIEGPFIDFSEISIPKEVSFRYFEFPYNVSFYNSIFLGDADFRETIFNGRITDFRGAQFSGGNADFHGATFNSKAHFQKSSFSKGKGNFQESHFNKTASFQKAVFSDGGAQFFAAKFSGNHTSFEQTRFAGRSALFDNATFDTSTNFSTSEFATDVSFVNCNFMRLVTFENAKFEKIPDFNFSSFLQPPYLTSLNLVEPSIHWAGGDNSLSERYRKLKQMAIQSNDHENEIRFFGLELHAKISQRDVKFLNVVFINMYRLCSNFGQSLLRPLFSIAFFLCIMILVNVSSIEPNSVDCLNSPKLFRSNVIQYTLTQATPLLSPSKERVEIINQCLFGGGPLLLKHDLWRLVHLIPTSLLLFLFGLAVRNWFKIR